MYLNFRGVMKAVGIFYVVFGLTMILPLITGVIYSERSCIIAFLAVSVPLMLLGILISKTVKPSPEPFKIRDGFLIVGIAWISAAFFGALPFMISGVCNNFFDALFESCSGISTTGSTIFTDIESLPKAILMWRSFTHFLGGLGVLYMIISLLPALGFDGQAISSSELAGPAFGKSFSKSRKISHILFSVYFALTFIETLLLMAGGMSPFDAITHAFSTMGTGGMSNYNDSIAHFDSVYIEGVIILFMVLAGVNINLFYVALSYGFREFFRDTELRVYLMIIAVISLIIALYNFADGTCESITESLRYALFNVSSIITTTGFANTDYDLWAPFPVMLLFIIMFTGGCASSTSGGIKISRIIVANKLIKRGIQARLHPTAVVKIDMNGRVLSIDTVESTTGFIFTYVSLIFGATVLISLFGYDLTTAFTAAAASIGNIGPGFNQVGPALNYSFFADPVKFLLSFLMIAGRLEVYTFFMMFSRRFWNPNR